MHWHNFTVACHCFYYHFRVSIAPPPSLYKVIYTRKGAGRWKHENDNKNSGKRLCIISNLITGGNTVFLFWSLAKTLGLTSIRYRFDAEVLDWCLIDVDLRIFVEIFFSDQEIGEVLAPTDRLLSKTRDIMNFDLLQNYEAKCDSCQSFMDC